MWARVASAGALVTNNIPDLYTVCAVRQQGLGQVEPPPGGDLVVLQVWLHLSDHNHYGESESV